MPKACGAIGDPTGGGGGDALTVADGAEEGDVETAGVPLDGNARGWTCDAPAQPVAATKAATTAAPARRENDCTDRGYCPDVSALLEGAHQVNRGVADGELLAGVRRPVGARHVVPVLGPCRSLQRVVGAGGPDRQQRLVAGRRTELAGVLPLVRADSDAAAAECRLADEAGPDALISVTRGASRVVLVLQPDATPCVVIGGVPERSRDLVLSREDERAGDVRSPGDCALGCVACRHATDIGLGIPHGSAGHAVVRENLAHAGQHGVHNPLGAVAAVGGRVARVEVQAEDVVLLATGGLEELVQEGVAATDREGDAGRDHLLALCVQQAVGGGLHGRELRDGGGPAAVHAVAVVRLVPQLEVGDLWKRALGVAVVAVVARREEADVVAPRVTEVVA